MKTTFLVLLSLVTLNLFSQTDSTKRPFLLSGYLETYYAYDFGNPSDHNRPQFVYSHNRHNEANLNLGFIKLAYDTARVRANLALMAGSYANANLAAEPGVLKHLFEGNMGVKLSKSKNIWLDAGVFSSHIGFENAIGKECWNLTRSILADNSPYYESGAKLSYTTNKKKWFVSFLVLNGWQRIQRLKGNNTPSCGHQVTFRPTSKITFNSSSFVGSDTPDSIRQMRYFHNFYGQFQLAERFGLIVGFDIGAQQKSKAASEYFYWYSPVLIFKYSLSKKIDLSARIEYYDDVNEVIISTGTSNGFQTYGYSVNMDYHIISNLVWRIEGRCFISNDKIFNYGDQFSNRNIFVATALALSL